MCAMTFYFKNNKWAVLFEKSKVKTSSTVRGKLTKESKL